MECWWLIHKHKSNIKRKVGFLEFNNPDTASMAKAIFEQRSPLPSENLKFDFIFDNPAHMSQVPRPMMGYQG